MEQVRLGIIGLGNMGSTHAKNITEGKVPGMVLGAICDIAEARRDFAKKLYPDVPVFDNAQALYESLKA